jgi:hypothetical protein
MVEFFFREVSPTLGKIDDEDIIAQGNDVSHVGAFARGVTVPGAIIIAPGVVVWRAVAIARGVTAYEGAIA